MPENVIEARNLQVTIPLGSKCSLKLLTDVNLVVAEAESLAIVGRSGSGKSTLLTMLALMGRPTGGTLHLNGIDVTEISESKAAHLRNGLMGFVFQSYSLVPHLNVYENVQLPMMYGSRVAKRDHRSRILAALESVGLADFAKRPPNQLSGGEQQRVAIARALVRNPPIVLADEPTGALDVDTGAHVIELLRRASSEAGSCLVLVTHDREIARSMNRTLELRDGQLVDASHGSEYPAR